MTLNHFAVIFCAFGTGFFFGSLYASLYLARKKGSK